jgi:uncharacterized membrane protein
MSVADRLEDVTGILVLGGGLVALALDYGWFWWVWVVGFVVVLPLVDLVVEPAVKRMVERGGSGGDDRDALDRLRERYARGELTDAEFERKVERLVATESVEDAERAVASGDGDRTGRGGDRAGQRADRDAEREQA